LEEEATGPACEKGASPRYQVWVDSLGTQHAAEGRGVDVVETSFDVKEKGGDFPFVHLLGLDFVSEGGASVRHRQCCQGAALMRVKQACHTSHTGKAVVHDPLKYLGEGSKKQNNTKGGGGVVSGLVRLVQDYAVSLLPRGRVEIIGDQWRK